MQTALSENKAFGSTKNELSIAFECKMGLIKEQCKQKDYFEMFHSLN